MSIVAGKDSAVTRRLNLSEELTLDLNDKVILDDVLSDDCFTFSLGDDRIDSLSSASVIIPNEMDYYGSEGDLKLQAKISVDGLGCDLPKFIISENLKDADGNDLFIIDSITGELKITEAGVNSFTNDAESLPDLHSINVHIENGHGGIGVKEMILVEKNPFYCAPDGTSDMGSIDSLLCCDDENSENDVFEFL